MIYHVSRFQGPQSGRPPERGPVKASNFPLGDGLQGFRGHGDKFTKPIFTPDYVEVAGRDLPCPVLYRSLLPVWDIDSFPLTGTRWQHERLYVWMAAAQVDDLPA